MSWLFEWVDAGNDPDFNRGDANGITGYFMALGDVRTTKAALAGIAGRSRVNGVYVGAGWWNNLSAKAYAAKANELLNPIRNASTRVMFNLEEHDPVRILAILTEFRRLNPKTALSWALEGMQGGWMDTAFVAGVVNLKVRVVPELFVGSMAPIDKRESDPTLFYTALKASLRSELAVVKNLTDRGFPAESVSPFYDGAWIPGGASGYVFTGGRLP
jgi:hypothetical protein